MLKFISPLVLMIMLSLPLAAVDKYLEEFLTKVTDLNITDATVKSELTGYYRRIPGCDLDEAFVHVQKCATEDELRYTLKSYTPGTEEEDDRIARSMCWGLGWFLVELEGGFDKYD